MEKRNYDRDMQAIVASLQGKKPRLLLHACCGPCSSAVLERLLPCFQVTVYFMNPCIHPETEYRRRLSEQKRLIREAGLDVPVLEGAYDPAAYFEAVRGLEDAPEGGARCLRCFAQRLNATAQTARQEGYDFFTTTLTVSPHKNAEALNRIGQEAAERWGVAFLPADFKKRGGYQRSLELSRQYRLYRQNYCGCVFSMRAASEEKDAPQGGAAFPGEK